MNHYWIEADFRLADDHMDALTNLYQPLFSYPALSLYLTLYGQSFHAQTVSQNVLMRTLHMDVSTLEKCRTELERFALIRTYFKEGTYSCLLAEPLRPSLFLNHPSYGRLYAVVMGNDAFVDTKARYHIPSLALDGSQDISASFDINRLASWSVENEKGFNSTDQKAVLYKKFDGIQFFKTVSHMVFPISMRTTDVIELVEMLGSTYTMTYSDMKSKLVSATNRQTKEFDKTRFIYLVEKEYGRVSADSVSDPFELDSLSYLAYRQNNDYIVEADKNLLKSLAQNFKFDHKVVNVLIDYVLGINDMNLSRAFVEKVASTWQRKGITSYEAAIQETKQQSKPKGQTRKAVKVVEQPVYTKTKEPVENIDEYRNYFEDFSKGGN